MAQAITSWLISDGRFRVQAINAVGRRSARIIEIEDVDTGERFMAPPESWQMRSSRSGSLSITEPVTLPRRAQIRLGSIILGRLPFRCAPVQTVWLLATIAEWAFAFPP